MNKKLLIADPKVCSGCRICELICSFHHEGVFNPSKSRVRVVRIEPPAYDFPVACKQCGKPPCKSACPVNAIKKNYNGILYVDDEACIGCDACAQACPFGAIGLDPERGIAMMCDSCGECVKRCPPRTLRLLSPEAIADQRAVLYAKRLTFSIAK
ncbi:MAG: 4Fe-4S dicluster domain-containing protein [Candidatus Bathyarchaeia archaeon]